LCARSGSPFTYTHSKTRSSAVINDQEINETPSVKGSNFYNAIPLQGAKKPDGTRAFAERKDSASIADVGKEISPGILRDPTLSSDAECEFIAGALLERALENGELRGSKTVPATLDPTPAFAFSVSWLDDPAKERVLEEISLRKSGDSATTTLDFTGTSGVASEIGNLRLEARDIEDSV